MEKHQYLEIDGQLYVTCCGECLAQKRATPCEPCESKGYETWKEGYLNVDECPAADRHFARKVDFLTRS